MFNCLHTFKRKNLILLAFAILFWACNKENTGDEIKDVTGYTWNVYAIQEINDAYINPLPVGWQMEMRGDRTFYLGHNGTTSSGTYSWAARDSVTAAVTLSLDEWNAPTQYTAIANKWKNVIQQVNKVSIIRHPVQAPLGPPLSATFVMQFEGSGGFFYVYR